MGSRNNTTTLKLVPPSSTPEKGAASSAAPSKAPAPARAASSRPAAKSTPVAKAAPATSARTGRKNATAAQAAAAERAAERESRARMSRGKRVLVILGVIVLAVVSLYGPARDYYVARRSEAVLESQLAKVSSQNSSIESTLKDLQTKEGIEDEARKKGYVGAGETAVNVVDNNGNAVQDTSTDSSSSTSSSSTMTQDPWYVPVLDRIFGYSA